MEERMSITPVHHGLIFSGFQLKGKRPESVLEWSHATIAMAHFAVASDQQAFSEPVFFAVHEKSAEDVLLDLPVVLCGLKDAKRSIFGQFPLGGCVFHVEDGVGKGATFIPGLPEIGLGHSGVYAHVDENGRVHKMAADNNLSIFEDPDIAVLAELLTS